MHAIVFSSDDSNACYSLNPSPTSPLILLGTSGWNPGSFWFNSITFLISDNIPTIIDLDLL